MPRPQKREWKFPLGIYNISRELRIANSRLYNNLSAVGLREIIDEKDLQKISLYLVRSKAMSVESLVKVFGSQVTLGQLAQMEAEALGSVERQDEEVNGAAAV